MSTPQGYSANQSRHPCRLRPGLLARFVDELEELALTEVTHRAADDLALGIEEDYGRNCFDRVLLGQILMFVEVDQNRHESLRLRQNGLVLIGGREHCFAWPAPFCPEVDHQNLLFPGRDLLCA